MFLCLLRIREPKNPEIIKEFLKNFAVFGNFFCGHFIDGLENVCYKSWFSAEASKVRDDFTSLEKYLEDMVLPSAANRGLRF